MIRNLRVTLIHPAAVTSGTAYLFMPAGMFTMASTLLAAGIEVRLINEGLEHIIDHSWRLESDPWILQSDLIGIGLHWHEHSYGAVRAAKALRSVLPTTPIVTGGITASLFADDLQTACPQLDAVIIGQAEQQILDLAQQVAKHPQRDARSIVRGFCPEQKASALFSLAAHALPNLQHWQNYIRCDIHNYHPHRFWTTLWLKAGSGCPYNCSFCGGGKSALSAAGFPVGMHLRPPNHLAEDLAALAALGIHQVALTHDLALASPDYRHRLAAHLRQTDTRIGVYMEAWQCPDPAFIAWLAETFVPGWSAVAISPLSGDINVRAANGKIFTDQQLFSAAVELQRSGIRWEAFFAADLPLETSHSFYHTLTLAQRLGDQYRPSVIDRSGFTLDPMSPMYCHPSKYNIKSHFTSFPDYLDRTRARSHKEHYDQRGYHLETDTADWQQQFAAAVPPLATNACLGLSPLIESPGGEWL